MKIEPHKITIEKLVEGYSDLGENGVSGYSGALNIRPPYQREFIYKEAQRAAVIQTVFRGFPLNVMYWADHGDGKFEVMDGQQRTISIAQFVKGVFSFDFGSGPRFYYNLNQDEKRKILDYELFIYICSGTDSEKLEWFKTINIAGEKLTDQELRNAVYHGSWLSSAKSFFSRSGGPAATVSSDYLSGTPIRQELLEKGLNWISLRDGLSKIDDYMALHQHDKNADDIWTYFEKVIAWAKSTFTVKRQELKGVDWGLLYYLHGGVQRESDELEKKVASLMADEDVQKKSGIYSFVLDQDERHLNLRAFSPNQKREAYERQSGFCSFKDKCKTPGNSVGDLKFQFEEMEADHITPWSKGGHTKPENCQMLCQRCNRQKGNV
jgi:hypothetical protein